MLMDVEEQKRKVQFPSSFSFLKFGNKIASGDAITDSHCDKSWRNFVTLAQLI